ncbi:MAG: AI-2E family transporter, partial [Candidatus Obscuribacterales bacterium]|nr:AI-2E family transporter [Candidatus Obscuribacterales bacterium]
FIPEDRRVAVVELSGKLNVMLAKYIRSQIMLVILMSVVAYIILHFCFHIKYALLMAILTGLLEIIPILGPLFAISMAVIVGVSQQGVQAGCLLALCFWIARLVEDYVVVPRFVGHVIELHPLAIIFSVICGEVLAGALGMLIAIPAAAAVKEIVDFCYPSANGVHGDHGHDGNHDDKNNNDGLKVNKPVVESVVPEPHGEKGAATFWQEPSSSDKTSN